MKIANNVKILILTSIIGTIVIYILMKNDTHPQLPSDIEEKSIRLALNDENGTFPTLNRTSPPVYFMVIIKEETASTPIIKPRAACAIESASIHNPNSDINVLLIPWHDQTKNVTSIDIWGDNVKMMYVNASDILKNTPLAKWYSEGSFRTGNYAVTHLSDALRIATLWKYGGIYLDTDMWSVKSVTQLRNTIGAENLNTVNGAAMMFDKFHPFLFTTMLEFVKKYNKNMFTVVGPRLLTDIVRDMCQVKGKLDSISWKSYKSCSNVTVLPPFAFYAIDYELRDKFFSNGIVDWIIWWNSYTFHLWNQVTGKTSVIINSKSTKTLLEQIAETNCPEVYKLAKQKGIL